MKSISRIDFFTTIPASRISPMKTFQGAFHMNPDYTTYGYAKMKKDVVEIREMAADMKKKAGK
jgi:hypothetical protein